MLSRLLLPAALAAVVALTVVPTFATADCQFVLGFAALKALIDVEEGPEKVGECLENQHSNPANGDALQQTTGGLMAWRKADNWTAFTDGYRTWINGPNGLEARLNTEQFEWELPPTPTPAPTPTPVVPTIDYKELFRNSDHYYGQTFKFVGSIEQVIERGGSSFEFRVDVTPDDFKSNIIYLTDYTGQRLIDDDRIEFTGVASGLQTYESIFGQSITIPEVRVLQLRLIEEEEG